jgi:hypothetical protein
MMGDWTFFSNYGHVLVCLARNRQARLRDVAAEVGITERAVQKIVRDLQDAGFLTVTKQGRCNRYRINKRRSLRHGLESHCTVGKLLALLAKSVPAEGVATEPGAAAFAQAAISGQEQPDQAQPVSTPPATGAGTIRESSELREREEAQKKEKKRASVDTRQQGSLF